VRPWNGGNLLEGSVAIGGDRLWAVRGCNLWERPVEF